VTPYTSNQQPRLVSARSISLLQSDTRGHGTASLRRGCSVAIRVVKFGHHVYRAGSPRSSEGGLR
jgi:hypothetical protein